MSTLFVSMPSSDFGFRCRKTSSLDSKSSLSLFPARGDVRCFGRAALRGIRPQWVRHQDRKKQPFPAKLQTEQRAGKQWAVIRSMCPLSSGCLLSVCFCLHICCLFAAQYFLCVLCLSVHPAACSSICLIRFRLQDIYLLYINPTNTEYVSQIPTEQLFHIQHMRDLLWTDQSALFLQ